MKVCLITLFLFGGSWILAQMTVTKEYNLPKNGDVLYKQKIKYISHGNSGEDILWDFSNVSIIDGNYKVCYQLIRDSILHVFESDSRFDYGLKGDSLLWLGFENNLTKVCSAFPAIDMIYPLTYGQSAVNQFYLNGKYSQSMEVVCSGKSSIEADATGTVILPPNDTLCNVMRIHKIHDTIFNVGDSIKNNYNSTDSIVHHIEDIYSWYADGFRYPVAEAIEHTYKKKEKTIGKYGHYFICTPDAQQSLKPSKISHNMNYHSASKTGIRHEPNTRNSTDKIYGNMIFNQTKYNINIQFSANQLIELEIILTDLQGRVFGGVTKRIIGAGDLYDEYINTDNLLSGSYLLYIDINGDKHVRKFFIP